MKWETKIELGMELIHEACKENSEIRCEICPFQTYCDIIYGALQVAPDRPDWVKMGGEDIR